MPLAKSSCFNIIKTSSLTNFIKLHQNFITVFCVKLWFRVLGSRLNRVLGSSLSRERAGWDLLHRGLGLGLGRGLLPHRLACRLGRLVKTCGKSYTADMWEVPHSRHVGSFPQPTCGKSNNRMFFLHRRSTSTIRGDVRCPRLLSDLGELCPYASQDKQGNVHQTP